MICPNCGSNNKDGTTFCGKCGEKIPDISDLFSDSKESPKPSITNNESSSEILPSSANTSDVPKESTLEDNNQVPTFSYPSSSQTTVKEKQDTATPNTLNKKTSKADININFDTPAPKRNESLVGFSKVISTPEFIKKHRQYNLKMLLISLIVIPLPVVLLVITKSTSDKESLVFGSGVSLFLAFIFAIVFLAKAYKKPWEGVIISKDVEYRVRHKKYGSETYEVYVLKVSTDSGELKYIQEYDSPGFYYKHFNVDERIKYHPSISYYEKYDKTKDKELLCPFCSTVSSITSKKCKKCGTPLIK